jgi:hypothetical protein
MVVCVRVGALSASAQDRLHVARRSEVCSAHPAAVRLNVPSHSGFVLVCSGEYPYQFFSRCCTAWAADDSGDVVTMELGMVVDETRFAAWSQR